MTFPENGRSADEILSEQDLWLRVRTCFGGFLAPFPRSNGADIPAFDFACTSVNPDKK